MQVFRCRICGDAYVGEESPHSCPFCGAHQNFLVLGKDWKEENKNVELSEVSKKNLEKTLELEISNANFYKCAALKAEDPEVSAMFKSLAKIEAEHADVACKLLGIKNTEETKELGLCKDDDINNLSDSHEREERAINFYEQFQKEAEEPRVKLIFGALIQIEKDHLEIGETELRRLS